MDRAARDAYDEVGAMTIEGPLLGEYCEACLEVFKPYVEDCAVPTGQVFTFCQYCACEKGAFPVAEIEAARVRVWENLKKRVGA